MQDLAPCHRLMMSQSVSTQGGCGLWFPVGMGSLGGRRNEPSCLCAAWQVDVLSPLSLPCCLTALSVLGLGLMVPPVHQDSGADTSHKAGQVGTAQMLHRDNVKTLLFALLYLEKSRFLLNPASLPIPLQ